MTNDIDRQEFWACDVCQVETSIEWDEELEQDVGLPAFAAPWDGRVINICDQCAGDRGPHELTDLAYIIAESSRPGTRDR
ncbi:hypothetical protein NN3_01060 [Nocardia neocaledoniensis NBRC 108232]|uniref:hypothetical protein n=1 Tax=Nocardia neocaledoniensis TaxID=236511 RepID=UPI001190978B|nr:hypothetical protein [Nocardia neocaledoniensis]GEM29099.1 hypothetical protein NN3_01060 [Nocardia neocaledoniensis NBRC 108232]